jgi:hypothetical protein
MELREHTVARTGKLWELSPLGTGFLEDTATGARYGFHVSMMPGSIAPNDAPRLAGQHVRFEVHSNGAITGVTAIPPSHGW